MVIHVIGWNFQIYIPRSTCHLTKKMLQHLLKQWKHLVSIVGKISQREDTSIGLLIGVNSTQAVEPIYIMPSKNDGPYVYETKLGWWILGPVNGTCKNEICCNWINVRQEDTNEVGNHFFQAKTTVKETDVKERLTRLYNQKFSESGSPR